MEELDLDNILSGDEIATLFEEPPKKESKEQILKRYLSDPRHKRIDCFNLNGDFIKTFFSLKEASNELNIPYQAIQRVLKGTRYKTRNLIFKYHKG